MIVRWLIVAGVGGALFVGGGSATVFGDEAGSASHGTIAALIELSAPLIDEVSFVGLHHLGQDAVRAQILSRAGGRLDLKRVESDVHALGRLGWFGEIEVETQSAKISSPLNIDATLRVRLVFHLEELPYLAKVEYVGSRLLSAAQIEKILGE
jgi:outer membrane protein assembly factor BamA